MGAMWSAKCVSTVRLDGKTAVVTGCNTGIGKETIKDFFKRGARVVMACRNEEKAQEAIKDIKEECAKCENLGQLDVVKLDLMSLQSVRACAKTILEKERRIDLLVNNAGVMTCPLGRTEDGFETQLGTNHLGHFLLTLLLLPKICQSTPARIVVLSSLAHKQGEIDFDDLNWHKRKYSALKAYSQSKLANNLFALELSKRLADANKNVNVYCLHPGVIKTDLGRHLDDTYFKGTSFLFRMFGAPFMKNPWQGAQTSIYCSVDEKCADETGLYYAECAVAKPSNQAINGEDAKRLWEESLNLVGLDKDFDLFKQQVL